MTTDQFAVAPAVWYLGPGQTEALVAVWTGEARPRVERVRAGELSAWLDAHRRKVVSGDAGAGPDTVPPARRARAQAVAERIYREWAAAHLEPSATVGYYRDAVVDADRQFDAVEITVSHCFARPHPALGGRTFGAALADRVRAIRPWTPGTRTLEIGGGTGAMASALLDRIRQTDPESYGSLRYTILDVSPALQAAQRARCEAHLGRMVWVLEDVERRDFPVASLDVVVANEMIADLSVAPARKANVEARRVASEGERLILRYGLDCNGALDEFAVNAGAIRLIEHVARWLAPGGVGVVTEYGSPAQLPRMYAFPGHREHSIHFGHLETTARRLGLTTRLETMGAFLGFDPACQMLDEDCADLMAAILAELGLPAGIAAGHSSRDEVRVALGDHFGSFGSLRFTRLDELPRDQLSPFHFWALVVRRSEE